MTGGRLCAAQHHRNHILNVLIIALHNGVHTIDEHSNKKGHEGRIMSSFCPGLAAICPFRRIRVFLSV